VALILRLCRPAGWLLAAFILINSAGEFLCNGFAADHLWIRSAQLLPGWRLLALGLAAVLVLPDGFLVRRPRFSAGASALVAVFAGFAALDAWWFYRLLFSGAIRTHAVVPFSVLVAAMLAASALRVWRAGRPRAERDEGETGAQPLSPPRPARPAWRRILTDIAVLGAFGAAGMLAFVLTYGPTNYARPADCAVVLGAKAYRSGRPSLALYDRVMEGVALYKRGLVGKLVMSGAIDAGRGGVSEPEVMRRVAMEAGVPEEDVILDEHGDDSWATVTNTKRLMSERGWNSALLVSHYYHLPRLRLAADRIGLKARTVPCRQTRRLAKEPYGIARELAALGYYYFFHLPEQGC